jgi:cyanosortase A-associated protein
MNFWERIRVLLLSVTAMSTLVVLANISFSPTLGKNSFAEYILPQTVTLQEWQFLKSNDLPKSTPEELSGNDAIPSAKRYQFIQNKLFLELESRYVVHTDGNLNRLIERHQKIPISSINPSTSIRKKSGVGFYGLSSFQSQTYLDACINQRPGSTFTQAQFMANQTSYRMHPQQIIALLWGQERLNDHRCLWVHLAVPTDKTSPKSTEAMLEKAWFSLYPQMHAHFLKPSG